MEQLCHSTTIFTKYFPNLLKVLNINRTNVTSLQILAWSPPTYIAEFLQLIPVFISESTASEVHDL